MWISLKAVFKLQEICFPTQTADGDRGVLQV